MWYSADFSQFLIQLCIKKPLFGVRAEILLTNNNKGFLESRAILGSVKKYKYFGEIFTSALATVLWRPPKVGEWSAPWLLVSNNLPNTNFATLQCCSEAPFRFISTVFCQLWVLIQPVCDEIKNIVVRGWIFSSIFLLNWIILWNLSCFDFCDHRVSNNFLSKFQTKLLPTQDVSDPENPCKVTSKPWR